MVIKDCIQTAGIRTTIGALFDQDFVPNQDAEVVRRLRAAGAVLVGKANLHGLVFGITRTNPSSASAGILGTWTAYRAARAAAPASPSLLP